MSKLSERLERASAGATRPLGFSNSAQERIPPVALIASVAKPTKALVAAAVAGGAEFVVVPQPSGRGSKTVTAPTGIGATPWGVRTESLTADEHENLKNAKCDFVLLAVAETPLRLLNDDGLGYVGVVPADTEDRWLRAIEQLPFEAVVVEAEPAGDLTLRQILEYAAVAGRMSRHVIAPASLTWGAGEVEQLRDMGFSALIVDVSGPDDAQALAALRDAILALPVQSRRRRGRNAARLPQPVAETAAAPAPPDEGDDDDDDFDDE